MRGNPSEAAREPQQSGSMGHLARLKINGSSGLSVLLVLSGAAIRKSICCNIKEGPRIRGVKDSSEMLGELIGFFSSLMVLYVNLKQSCCWQRI